MSEQIPPIEPQEALETKNRRTIGKLSLMVLGMFGFGFAMVPLYQWACQVGGLNGVASSAGRQLATDVSTITQVDENRLITVQFDATINQDLPWQFYPITKQLTAHPGERVRVDYFVKNDSSQPITAQAVPGVTPWQMTEYFKKIECFCFTQQTLQAGESKKMPVWFTIDPKADEQYKTVTLSYTFMNTDRQGSLQAPQQHAALNHSNAVERSVD